MVEVGFAVAWKGRGMATPALFTCPPARQTLVSRLTWEAHTKGRAVAKTCHRELAELYEERLRAKGLIVSVEPVGQAN